MFKFVALGSLLVLVKGQFDCPKASGRYADPDQCDKYWECVDGVPEEKLCEDGLVYDPTNPNFNKCDQVFNVDCGDRTELQPAQGNDDCPRLNGFFAHPDPHTCHIFYTCNEGVPTSTLCPFGLVFDIKTGTCSWPESVKRKGCKIKSERLGDGFECPTEPQINNLGLPEAHPKYAHEDCIKFYLCINGVTPRVLSCEDRKVFNEANQQCDTPDNVPECADYFANEPEPPKKKKPFKKTVVVVEDDE